MKVSKSSISSSVSSSSVSADCGLLVFTRLPVPGKTKTRLIPSLGTHGAANLQKQMTEHLLTQFQNLQQLTLQVHFAGGTAQDMRSWLGNELTFIAQSEGDLGVRLASALRQGFTAGLQRIVIVGSDCPTLGEAQIIEAFLHLQSHDVVIGPATDGGYYLIGLNQLHAALFENIPWGSDRVFTITQEIAHRQNLSVALLSPLSDIDRPEDVPLWHQITAQKAAHQNPVIDNTGKPQQKDTQT